MISFSAMVISGHRHAGKIVDLPERRRTNERAIMSCAEYRDPNPTDLPLDLGASLVISSKKEKKAYGKGSEKSYRRLAAPP